MHFSNSPLLNPLSSHAPLLVMVALVATPLAGQTDYEIDHLGSFGGSTSFAMDINDSGVVVGYSEHVFQLGSQYHSWQWINGTESEVPTLGGINSWAFGTNNSQQLVGMVDYGINGNGQPASGLYPMQSDLWLDTPTEQLDGIFGTFGRPEAINDSGVIVGVATSASTTGLIHDFHGAIWAHGTVTEIHTLGGNWSQAFDVNNKGVVAVGTKDGTGTLRAAIWKNGVLTALPDLGFGGGARAINDFGIVAGWVYDSNYKEHAAMWDRSGVHDLGTLGGLVSWANDINNDGVIVGQSGWASGGGGGAHAFVVDNGLMYDLNAIPTGTHNFQVLKVARSINDAGQIVGWGETTGEYTRAWIANPQVFRLTGLDAAVADGKQRTMEVEGASPNSTLIAYWGLLTGGAVVNGVPVFMSDPKPLRTTYSDALGHAWFGAIFPPRAAAGITVIVQAIELPAGQIGKASNPLYFTFRP